MAAISLLFAALPLRRRLVKTLLLAIALPLWSACSSDPELDALRVSLDEGRTLLEQGQTIVFDIREPKEHATGVADGVRLLPVSQLEKRLGEIPRDPSQPVLLICNTQNRSSRVAMALKEAGWNNVRFIHGGMEGWARRGWPMVKP